MVVAALLRQDGRILVSRRRADQAMPLFWEFPGGKVEPGEAPAAALAREVMEELGCQVQVGRIEEVVFHAYPEFDLLMLVYACHVLSGTHAPWRWPKSPGSRQRTCRGSTCFRLTSLWPNDWPEKLPGRLSNQGSGGVGQTDGTRAACGSAAPYPADAPALLSGSG